MLDKLRLLTLFLSPFLRNLFSSPLKSGIFNPLDKRLLKDYKTYNLPYGHTHRKSFLTAKVVAATLIEMLVVLMIVGILVLIALPNFLPVVNKARATEAKIQLQFLHTLEKNYFYEFSKYSGDLNELNFTQQKLTTEGKDGHSNYRIEIKSFSATGFVAQAVSVVDFDGDGQFNTWEIDENKNLKETVRD